jgi:hypothetical protein
MSLRNILRLLRPASTFALASLVPGCHLSSPPLPEAPPVTELELAAPPSTVLKSAADLLQGIGWWVAPVDTLSGQLRAERRAKGDANGEWMVCVNGVGRTGDTRRATKDLTSTVLVQLRADAKGSGSLVRIKATVPSAYSVFAFTERGPPEYAVAQCVSSGGIENRLRESLGQVR